MKTMATCVTFASEAPEDDEEARRVTDFCDGRERVAWSDSARHGELASSWLVHLPSAPKYEHGYRWLTHFYTWVRFGDPDRDRAMKRWVRDELRYVVG